MNNHVKLRFLVTSFMLVAAQGTLLVGQNVGQVLQPQTKREFQLKGEFQLEQNTRVGYLVLSAEIPEGSYIYSLTQKDSPPPSTIEIASSESFRVTGKFQPDKEPKTIEHDPIFEARLEKHTQNVRFFIPLQIADNLDPTDLRIRMRFNGQVCSDEGTCRPISDKIVEAEFGGYYQRVAERNSTANGTTRN